MPQFNLSEQEVDDIAEFLKWSSKINTNGSAAKQGGLEMSMAIRI